MRFISIKVFKSDSILKLHLKNKPIFYNLKHINKDIYLYSTQRIYLFIYLDRQ